MLVVSPRRLPQTFRRTALCATRRNRGGHFVPCPVLGAKRASEQGIAPPFNLLSTDCACYHQVKECDRRD
jgi:hypothetical protein